MSHLVVEADFWVTVMQNYEAKKPSYFSTPSPQLVRALNTAVGQILARPLSERFQRHIEVSNKVKKAVADLGLKVVATKPEDQAHAMTAIYLPDGVSIPDVIPKLLSRGIIFAGGLHKEIGTKYIRFGHMGPSAVSRLAICFCHPLAVSVLFFMSDHC
jgi:alanine-glyoxylate transaminase/serine-glyoxylate transaminase/serine-pyruvate transaminase